MRENDFGVAYLIRAASIQILMHFYFLLYKDLLVVFQRQKKRHLQSLIMVTKGIYLKFAWEEGKQNSNIMMEKAYKSFILIIYKY